MLADQKAINEREYWTELWLTLKTAIPDPIFDYKSFWRLPSTFIWKTAKDLRKQQQDRANEASISTAKLADVVVRMVAKDYKGSALDFLPYPPKSETPVVGTEGDENIDPSLETLQILFKGIADRTLPAVFVTQIYHLLPKWREKLGQTNESK